MPKIRRTGERGGVATNGPPPKLEAVAEPKRKAKKEAPVPDISGDVTTIDKPKPAARTAKARKASR